MPQIKLIFLYIFIFSVGCSSSWKKDYISRSLQKNLVVDIQLESGGGFASDWVELDIFEEQNSCRMKYRGTLKLKKNTVDKFSLENGYPLNIVLNRNQSTYFGNRVSNERIDFRITPKAGVIYKIRHRERGSSSESLMSMKSPNSNSYKEISSHQRSNCVSVEIIH